MIDKNNIDGFITDEYIRLYSIKSKNKFLTNLDTWIKRSQLEREEGERYKTFISRSVSDQQKADLLYNNPIFDFIPLDNESRRKIYKLEQTWKYWWKVDETDSKIYDVVSDSADFGSGFLYQGWKIENRKVEYPKKDKLGNLIFEEKEIEQYNGVYSEYVRIEDIFFDGPTIEESNCAIWRKFWNIDDFIDRHKSNSLYKNLDKTKISGLDLFLAGNPKLPQFNNIDSNQDLLLELRYYNLAEDKLIITANGTTVYNTPIPHLHKELPFCKYDNHIIRNRLIQLGNYELLEDVEEYNDKIRQQTIDITKANIGFNIIEKDSDFDPETYKVGVNEFIELENPDSIKHFSSNIQPQGLVGLQQSGQEDVIVLSGVDYRSQLLQTGETATKTTSKNQAQQKRINLILKRNSFKFYNRLAKLRLADLQLVSSFGDIKIPIKGGTEKDGNFVKLQNGYGIFTVKPEDLKGKFNIVLQTESLLGDSTEKEKENYLNFFQIFGNLVGEDQKRIINPTRMVEIAGQKIGVDVDTLLEKELINKSGADIINSLIQQKNGNGEIGNQSNNPNSIPPENRANNAGGVNVIGGGNTANQL